MDVEAALKAELSVLGGEKLHDGWTIPPGWFARRYGIAPPSVYRQIAKAFDESKADVYYLKASSPGDASRLWGGLEADLTANQRLVRKGESLVWIISTSAACQDRIVAFLKPESQATRPKEDFDWLRSELPRDIPGLSLDHSVFVQQMIHLEQRTGGLPVRAMYQATYVTPRQPLRRQLAQVDFWIPRDRAKLEDLTRFFESRRESDYAVYTGKGVVAVLTARNPVGRKILADRLDQLGYKRVSPPDPTPTAPPGAKTGSEHASEKG
jgi:hypothetical protein